MLLVALIAACVNGLPNLLHHVIVKIKIVKNTKTHAQHLLSLQKMADVGSAVAAAGRALTALLYGPFIQLVLGIKQIQLAMVGIYMAMAAITAGI